ncbi:hypothetical protein HELRODRAFT_185559 [Helobdella robusta]|uniref:UBC core domain-containing protein n=1 Tax=Helobdella robusta TaxID=6412 RepID=T1FMZ4_HELRO|nr:hypothetical protein HELRODRAFT_185559 [Helobdella robusta]ESO04564.1 hypothetical protein HELRODRAFT_185559 [Helobdella robusta]
MAHCSPASAIRALQLELKKLNDEPVEGFRVRLFNDSHIFEWEVALFGPPGTLYEGGYFKAIMRFPTDYPYSPPSVRFLCKMFHPNVYENGFVCISILHPPIDDPQSGELPSERWNPTQNVRTILLSIISLLNEPNTASPANVDASVAFRKWKDSKGKNKDYENIVRKQVRATRLEAEKDNVTVPTTLQEYCVRPTASSSCQDPSSSALTSYDHSNDVDFYDDDYLDNNDDDDDGEDDDEDVGGDHRDDSGVGERRRGAAHYGEDVCPRDDECEGDSGHGDS